MATNQHILERLAGIRKQLIAVHQASSPMSSATKGQERQGFIDNFLSQVFSPIYRFGTGDVTDKTGGKSGQLDVVIEYPFGPSLPLVGGGKERLYLAESAAAVIEVKSDVSKQWDDAVATADKLYALDRSFGATMSMGPVYKKVPLFVVGYTGWKDAATVKAHLASTKAISGIYIIDQGIFQGANDFNGVTGSGDWGLWGLVYCLQLAVSSLKAASTNPMDYT